jgi:hypothetical protein
LLLLLVGCVLEKPVAQRPAATPAAPQNAGSAQKPQTAPAPVPAAPTQPPPAPSEAGASRGGVAGSAAATGTAAAPGTAAATGGASAKTKVPGRGETAATSAPRAAAPGSASPGSASPGTTAGGTAAHPAAVPAPALDLASLEQRLRDTRAIGLFTKLSLKNQVDDLLGQFRAFHRRQAVLTVAELRQKYDLLLLKVLSLLQDGDPPLAAAISSSREAIWAMLIDPQKFEKLARI